MARNKFRYSDGCHNGLAELVLPWTRKEPRRPYKWRETSFATPTDVIEVAELALRQTREKFRCSNYQLPSKIIPFEVIYHRITLPDVSQELFTVLAQIVSIARKWILSQRLMNIF